MPSKNKSRSGTPRHKTPTKSKSKSKSRSQTPNHVHSSSNNTNTNNSNSNTYSETTYQNLSPRTKTAFLNALEDVHTRFILNLPMEELSSSDRLFFQIEQAWWFYEDFICDEMDEEDDDDDEKEEKFSYANIVTKNENIIHYPRFPNLKPFAKKIFEISPLLSPLLTSNNNNNNNSSFESLWKEFTKYKRKISTYGTILLNKKCTKILLCQDYKSKSWTVPAGKVNQNEKGIDAAIRETYEETGFDIDMNFGLTKRDYYKEEDNDGNQNNENDENNDNKMKCTWSELSEEHSLVYIENDGSGKRRTCFICHGIPEKFDFAPVVRKEVADVQWHDIDDLPKKTFAVLPFMKGLRKWIRINRKKNNKRSNSNVKGKQRDESKRKGVKGNNKQSRNQRPDSKGRSASSDYSYMNSEDDDLVQSGLGKIGDMNRWSEDDMFRTNEELIGRKIDYDGNPQQFATKGFDGGIDPHAFHIVGGGFMNSGVQDLADAPDKSQLQPLFRKHDDNEYDFDGGDEADDGDLKPFFNDDGATPWGEKVLIYDNTNKGKKKRDKKHKQEPPKVVPSSPFPKFKSERAISEAVMKSAADFEEHLFSDRNNASNNESESLTERKKSGLAILAMLRGGEDTNEYQSDNERIIPASRVTSTKTQTENEHEEEVVDVFMTDKEITAKSQKEKKEVAPKIERQYIDGGSKSNDDVDLNQETKDKSEHFAYLKKWVSTLPQSKPSQHFGDFRFDVDAIMAAVTKM